MIKRRLGPAPHADDTKSAALKGCADIFELDNGDFAIIGLEATKRILTQLPADASCGPDERIVIIPRKTLVLAKSDIPQKI